MTAKSRTADLYAKRSESPQSALNVEMCMAQHLTAPYLIIMTHDPKRSLAECPNAT